MNNFLSTLLNTYCKNQVKLQCVFLLYREEVPHNLSEKRLVEKHFPKYMPPMHGARCIMPSRLCYACLFTNKQKIVK